MNGSHFLVGSPARRTAASRRLGLSLSLALGLGACAPIDVDDSNVTLEGDVAALDIPEVPTGIETAGTLGQGRDVITEEFRGDCVRSATTVTIPLQEASLRFDASLLRDEASEVLGFSAETKGRFKLVSGSAKARFSRSLTSRSLSLGMFYLADYKLGVERLDQGNLQWLVQPGAPDFVSRCGDHFLHQRERGGQLFLLYRIDFASSEAKQEFEASVGGSFAGSVAALDANAQVSRVATRFLNRASVHVEAFQVGGDVTRLSSILGGGGPDANAGRVILDCSMANLAPCGQFMQNAINYASAQTAGSFSDGLRASPADRTYLFKDWALLGVSVPQRRVPAAVKTARYALRELFDAQVEFADRVALLRSGKLFVHADLQARLDGYARKVQQNLALLSDAVDQCYDFLVDPANAQLVASCTGAAGQLDGQGFDRTLTMDKLVVPPPSVGTKVVERTDPSGRVTVAIFERQADTAAQNFRDFPVSVPPEYVVIGGGAEGTRVPSGTLLTASYPSPDGWSWLVSSKDHFAAEAHRVKAYAIGVKVAGMSRSALRSALLVQSVTSPSAVSPSASVALPSDYAMLGGGFFVDYRGVGNLATASYPLDAQTWQAASKSHHTSDPSPITVYAIGVRRTLDVGVNLSTVIRSVTSPSAAHPSVFVTPQAGSMLVGCGGSTGITPSCSGTGLACLLMLRTGRLLWKVKPDATLAACDIGAKDHYFSSPGTVTGYALGLVVN